MVGLTLRIDLDCDSRCWVGGEGGTDSEIWRGGREVTPTDNNNLRIAINEKVFT